MSGPLAERNMEEEREVGEHGGSSSNKRQRYRPVEADQVGFVVAPPRSLTINTGRENTGKRARDARSWAGAQHPATTSSNWREAPGASAAPKKPRPGQGGQHAQKPGSKATRRGAGPKLERKVGVMAPNGNPQCWIAPEERETDPHRVAQRMKQIEYGKNSTGYKIYLSRIPKDERRPSDPQTPDVHTKCSKRCFDGLLRSWRRRLHLFDPPDDSNESSQLPAPATTPGASSQPAAAQSVSDANIAREDHMAPVAWEDIEKLSAFGETPRSWADDKDSDISEPDSADRVTIYTTELSPEPSELAPSKSGELDLDVWGTPRSRLSSHATEPSGSPASPWMPWVSEAFYTPGGPGPGLAGFDPGYAPGHSHGQPSAAGPAAAGAYHQAASYQSHRAYQPAAATAAQPACAPGDVVTFGEAFKAGLLPSTSSVGGAGIGGVGRQGSGGLREQVVLGAGARSSDVFTSDQALPTGGLSISMRAAPGEVPCIPDVETSRDGDAQGPAGAVDERAGGYTAAPRERASFVELGLSDATFADGEYAPNVETVEQSEEDLWGQLVLPRVETREGPRS